MTSIPWNRIVSWPGAPAQISAQATDIDRYVPQHVGATPSFLPATTMSRSYFANSRDLRIGHATIITANNYIHNAPSSRNTASFDPNSHHAHSGGRLSSDKESLDLLRDNIAAEAIHNSDERCDAPKVHPETRKAVQEEIFGWISHGEGDVEPKKILWMSGPAGSGKTAIAGSIAELCEEQGLLAGSFFFSSYSGSEKRRSKRCVVATLVYSLLRHKALRRHGALQSLREAILSVIEHDPAIFRTSLRNQCRILLVQPFYDVLALDISTLPRLILLDGLDEVLASSSRQLDQHDPVARLANEADQVEILAALLQAAHDPKFPFRIIVASRPERVISDFFATKANHVSREIFLDDKYDPDFDIALFLNAKFAEIRRRYRLAAAWPGEDDIGKLVANASGQFIYADTVVRFLESGKRPNPQLLLRTILGVVSRDPTFNALAPLDALYVRILMSSPDPPLAVRWIGVIEYLLDFGPSAVFVRQLLQDFEGQAEYLLENLASLVHIPLVHDDQSSYKIYHKSLLDFLSSARRCGQALKDSYAASLPFFCDRWFGVLKAMSPVVSITCSQWPDFLVNLWNCMLLDELFEQISKHHSCEGQLANCDVGGWVHAITAVFHNDRHTASIILQDIFYVIRFRCFSGAAPGICSMVCRHWRSNILGECKALGWVVPNVIAMLREWFWDKYCDDKDFDAFAMTFRAPTMGCSHSPFHAPRDSAGVLASQTAYLNEYDAQYQIINSIYDALPAGWNDQVTEGMELGRTFDDCIRRQLRKVRPELLLRLEGLNAWVRLSDAYGSEYNEPESENEDEGEDDGSASEDEDEDDAEGSGSSQNEILRSDDSAEREDVNMDESTDSNSYSGGDHGGGNIELNETVPDEARFGSGHSKEVGGFGDEYHATAPLASMDSRFGGGPSTADGRGFGCANAEWGAGGVSPYLSSQHVASGWSQQMSSCVTATSHTTLSQLDNNSPSTTEAVSRTRHLESFCQTPNFDTQYLDRRARTNAFPSSSRSPFDTPHRPSPSFFGRPTTTAGYQEATDKGLYFGEGGYQTWLGWLGHPALDPKKYSSLRK